MNYIDKLLQGKEVEWKTLGDVCKIVGRIGFRGYTKKDIVEEKEGAISLSPSNIKDNEIDYTKCTYISWLKYEESPEIKINNGDIIFCKTASIGKTALIKSLPKEATINPQLVVFKEIKCNNGYLAHIVKSANFKKQISSIVGVGSVPSLSQKDLRKLLIPIPYPNDPEKSLAIQQEIVRVLDSLSEQKKALTTALANEIGNRKKQYAYYREELFRFEGKEVEWKTLGENISKTSNIKWSHTDGNFRYIDLSSVDRDKKFITETTEINAGNAPSRAQKIVIEDDVIFATTRPTQMRVCLITEEFSNQIASTGFCVLRAMKNTVLPKWILYQLTSNSFKNYLEENQAGIAYPAISDAKIKDFKIPIPFPNDKDKSIQEQERIVQLLDRFDEATKSIVTELEKEIELRNKQYEYYRNQLLIVNC